LNGKEHGFGIFIDTNGISKEGEWEEGKWKNRFENN